MKWFLRMSVVVVLLVGALMVGGLLLPSQFRVERAVTIAAPPTEVFRLVGDLHHWREWAPWHQRDPQLEVSYSVRTDREGSWMTWQSRREGRGRLTVQRRVPPELLHYQMQFEGMPLEMSGTLALVSDGAGRTIVTWRVEGALGRSPLLRWFGRLQEWLQGPELERGLQRLQEQVERKR
jgi:uncharacterized protein YndB with AHSA1/START domain